MACKVNLEKIDIKLSENNYVKESLDTYLEKNNNFYIICFTRIKTIIQKYL
jgi:hypothetical protein